MGHRHIYINLNSLKAEYVHGGRGVVAAAVTNMKKGGTGL